MRLQRLRSSAQSSRAQQRLESEVQLRTRELVESNRQLAEAARAKSDFLDRMSHELRTPMNGVVGMTELLARTALSATQAQLTQTIRSSAQVLLQIVNDLLDLSKISAGKVALEALPIDLGRMLEECTSLFAGAAEAKGIELIVCPPARRAAQPARRSAAGAADPDESGRQRGQVHRAGRDRRQGRHRVREPDARAVQIRDHRHRHRHGCRDDREDLRALHPGGRVDDARASAAAGWGWRSAASSRS